MKKPKLLKRRTAQTYHHYETALQYLNEIHSHFEGHHSGLDEVIVAVAQLTITAQNMLKAFWEKAWGEFPEDYRTWF